MTFIKIEKTEESVLDDQEIVRRIVHEGDKELMDELYNRYATKIYHKCISLTKDMNISKDLTHDILVKVFLNLSKYKGTASFSLWIHSITYNYCMDFFRKKKKLPVTSVEEEEFRNISDDKEELELKKLKEFKLEQLERLVEYLRPDDKVMLLMRYQDGLSIKNISATLNLKEGAVKMRLKRSRERLAKLVKKTKNDE